MGNTTQHAQILDFMALADGEGLTLAHDIAMEVGIPPRAMGAKLRGLEKRGLIERRVARPRPSMKSDNLYGWQLTEKGREEVSRV